jgi:hypothetical protein
MKNFLFLSVLIASLQTQAAYAGEEINIAAAIGSTAIEKPTSTTAETSPESEGMSTGTKTLLIVGGVVVVGIIAALSSGGSSSTTSH